MPSGSRSPTHSSAASHGMSGWSHWVHASRAGSRRPQSPSSRGEATKSGPVTRTCSSPVVGVDADDLVLRLRLPRDGPPGRRPARCRRGRRPCRRSGSPPGVSGVGSPSRSRRYSRWSDQLRSTRCRRARARRRRRTRAPGFGRRSRRAGRRRSTVSVLAVEPLRTSWTRPPSSGRPSSHQRSSPSAWTSWSPTAPATSRSVEIGDGHAPYAVVLAPD